MVLRMIVQPTTTAPIEPAIATRTMRVVLVALEEEEDVLLAPEGAPVA